MKTTTQKFTMLQAGYEGQTPQPVFAFDAKDEADALDKASRWSRHHSFARGSVTVRPATAPEAEHCLHNEYVS